MKSLYAGITIQDVINNYSDMLIRIAYQNTKKMSDAEDIVQEVYIKLLKCKNNFSSIDHLKAWLIKTTFHRCKDFFRSSWFKKVNVSNDMPDIIAPDEEEVMIEIFELDKVDRTIIYLYYYEGYSIKEIAVILGKKENTISSRIQRARKKLKVIIEEGRGDNG